MRAFRDVESIERETAAYPVVSFDIFDTLLVRRVPEPADVFELVEALAGEKGLDAARFRGARVEAERSAVRKNQDGEEVSLAQIYAELPYSDDVRVALMGLELEAERRVLAPNVPMVALARRCREADKTVVIASDMYLPASFLREVLEGCGVPFDRLYVSSEVGLRKSRGGMFDHIAADLGVEKGDILHIGDNRLSDASTPARKGLGAAWYRPGRAWAATPREGCAELLSAGIASRPCARGLDGFGAVGFSCLGPLLVGLCQWARAERDKRPGSTLHFLARDGYVVSKAYDILYPGEGARYTYVSRRSLTVPLLADAGGWADVVERVPYVKRRETMASLLEKVGLVDEEFCSDLRSRYGDDIARSSLLDGTLDGLFVELRDRIRANAAEEREAMEGYLAQEMGDDPVLVDVGWYGTIQRCLERAAGRHMHGLYVGLLRHDPDYALEDAKGYAYDYRAGDKFDSSLVFSFNGLIETFFSAPHGSVRRYRRGDDGAFGPVLAATEDENAEALSRLHDGALVFVREYAATAEGLPLRALRPEHAFANMERLLTLPTAGEVDLLGGLWFYDASYDPLVCFQGAGAYARNPKAAVRDLMRSNWKMGFLRRLLPSAPASRAAYRAMMRAKGAR